MHPKELGQKGFVKMVFLSIGGNAIYNGQYIDDIKYKRVINFNISGAATSCLLLV